jgi:preprotein translocase subunit SecG
MLYESLVLALVLALLICVVIMFARMSCAGLSAWYSGVTAL